MRPACSDQSGATLITVLVMLLLVLMLGLATAQMAVQGEKAARNDRDRHIAFQAAEAALLDAEMDIAHSPDPLRSRSHVFSPHSESGFPMVGEASCASGEDNIYLGLCRALADDGAATWKHIRFRDDTAAGMQSVPYGRFTGNQLLTGVAALPARAPRYVIELMVDHKVSTLTGKTAYFYRITAIAYGARPDTQVVLQSLYRKQAAGIKSGRLSWRELINQAELNATGS